MKRITATFTERIKRTPSIESFRFSCKERVDFIPGQFAQIIFDRDAEQNKELNKYLSFSSSPLRDYVEFTKRMSQSAFSQKLNSLKPQDELIVKGPMGNCTLREEHQRIGFLIGGIGITPVISIIEYIADKKLSIDVKLLYSNRTENEIAFKKELDEWSAVCPNVQVFCSITDCPPEDKQCAFGMLNREVLLNRIDDANERLFYIFGPSTMVETMTGVCIEAGCKAQHIKTEGFVGY